MTSTGSNTRSGISWCPVSAVGASDFRCSIGLHQAIFLICGKCCYLIITDVLKIQG